jgi:hypothetical protein
MNGERETRRQLRLGFRFGRKPTQLRLNLPEQEINPEGSDIINVMSADRNTENAQDLQKQAADQAPESADFNEQDYIKIPKVMSRRKFLTGVSLFAGSVVAGGILSRFGVLKSPLGEGEKPHPSSPTETHKPENTNATFSLEKEDGKIKEEDISLQKYGLGWTPDGHIPFFTTPQGKKRYFISANVSTWMIETDGEMPLKDYISSKKLTQDNFKMVMEPTGDFESSTDYKNGYTGITSVFQVNKDTDPNHLIGTTHYEQRASTDGADSYTASVGIVESFDGGYSWEDKGPIIKGRVHELPGERITGAGQPAAIIKDGVMHIMYVEWATGGDQIYSAKMKLNSDGSLGKLEDIVDDSGELKPVIPVPEGEGYAALPSLSYNEELKKYLCVIETASGFFETTSEDLVNWSETKPLMKYEEDKGARRGVDLKVGEQFITYPTLIDESQQDDHTTGKESVLYFATRQRGKNSHNLKAVNVKLNA